MSRMLLMPSSLSSFRVDFSHPVHAAIVLISCRLHVFFASQVLFRNVLPSCVHALYIPRAV